MEANVKKHLLGGSRDALRVGAVLAVAAALTGILLLHVWNQYQITHLGYRIAEVTHEHRRLLEENKKLSIEAAIQGRSERITGVAREQFGLQPLKPEQVRTIPADALDGVAANNGVSLHDTEHAALGM
jgi:cell division protein FtsL